MIPAEVAVGLPVAVIAVAGGAVLLAGRSRIAARLGDKTDVTAAGGGLAAAVIFLIGLCLAFMGAGIALFLVIRAVSGIAPGA